MDTGQAGPSGAEEGMGKRGADVVVVVPMAQEGGTSWALVVMPPPVDVGSEDRQCAEEE